MRSDRISAARRGCAAAAAVTLGTGLMLASTVPNLVLSDNLLLDTAVRKAGHFAAYLVLSILGCIALGGRLSPSRSGWVVVLTALLVALTDEVRQVDIAGRIASPLDVSIDVAGAIAGVATYRHMLRRKI